jgi:hypothetical protein
MHVPMSCKIDPPEASFSITITVLYNLAKAVHRMGYKTFVILSFFVLRKDIKPFVTTIFI